MIEEAGGEAEKSAAGGGPERGAKAASDPRTAGPSLLVVLAPHYDDGVFSVGGVVHRHVRTGGRAVVVTVFGGAPAVEADAVSPLARTLHERWARTGVSGALRAQAAPTIHPAPLAPGPSAGEWSGPLDAAHAIVELRRGEDRVALESLGAEQHVLDFPDCIYRRVGDRWRCASEADLFASDGPGEPELREAITEALEPFAEAAFVLAPLGLGRHVDHALTHQAARALPKVGYYEDVPYSLRPGGWARRYVLGLRPYGWPVEPVDLEAKARACLAYSSQWPTFWPDAEVLAADLRRGGRSGWAPGVWCETVWLAPDSPLRDKLFPSQGHPHR